ncbi:MAG TPA: hypothetical protein VH988_20650 [Thermoanaerobaculia bacterium]|jgi:hypothetical protein|nr:hypothetical protein [Thermoanaerobaculia bacterium]
MISSPELWQALIPVVDALEALGVPWHVGGSVASSFVGVARATQDADLVADLRPEHAEPFVLALQGTYYVDRERVDHAIQTRRSFNAIHLATVYKVDVFIAKTTPFARQNMARRVSLEVPGLGRSLWFSSPEDIVLHKLLWYADGGGVSDRQWYDLQGVLRLQGPRLDFSYLQTWAESLGISDLLTRALKEAGTTES